MRQLSKKNRKKTKQKEEIKGLQVLEQECIWMKAGVVNFRLCDHAYDCNNCPFDKGMRSAMDTGQKTKQQKKPPGWAEYLQKDYGGASRPCRHALTGRISAPKICTLNYECYHCPFDQMLDDVDLIESAGPFSYTTASGYRMDTGNYYHIGHSWAKLENGGRVRIGFDDFMVRLFGVLQSIELPPLGERLEQNRVGWTFGKNENRAAMLSPMSGIVLAVNHKTREHPEITHEDPYHEGWLLILEPVSPKKDLKGLYYGKVSFQWMDQEARKLMRLIGPKYENLAATGGEPIGDVLGNFPKIGWDLLTQMFLLTKKI